MADTTEIENLKAQITALTTRLSELENLSSRRLKTTMGMEELFKKHLNLHDDDLRDAFDRIKNIELKFFPNLARDIKQLHDVIGEGEDKAINPLDHRKK